MSSAQVVLAAGAWSARLGGLPAHAMVPVRPLKGQILRLRDPEGPGLLQRIVRFDGGYLVPRGDGRYVLGATVEERGFESEPTAGGVYELLRDAQDLVPGVRELQIEELSVGFRPSTPDHIPALGRGVLEGLLWATGHHRNGILLAPLTAELLAGVLLGSEEEGAGQGERDSDGDRGLRCGRALEEDRALEEASEREDASALEEATEREEDRALLSACDPTRFVSSPARRGRGARFHGDARDFLLNGQRSDLCAGETVADALARLDLGLPMRGIAVAVDGEVVSRSSWETFAIPEGARVEVLTAIQGG